MTLRDGQLARLLVVDVETGAERMVAESAVLHIEAPNWTPDGRWLTWIERADESDIWLVTLDEPAPDPRGANEGSRP